MPTRDRTCVACFNKIRAESIHTLLLKSTLCDDCLGERRLFIRKERLKDMDVYYLSYHDGMMFKWLYQYKTMNDYELRSCFLTPYEDVLRLLSLFFCIVPLPSTKTSIERRGFNHLGAILEYGGVRYRKVFGKSDGPDQKDLSMDERKNVGDRIHVEDGDGIKGKRVILFDDVMTTGSSLLACKEKMIDLKPKSITGLVLMRQKL